MESSSINEVIRAVLNFLLFFYEKILHAQKAQKNKKHKKHKMNTKGIKGTKSTKKHHKHHKHWKHIKAQKAQKLNQVKAQNANKRTKTRNALKTSKGKIVTLFTDLRFCVCKEKSLYNRNVGLTKLVKVLSALYEQKLVY